jgi:hypothetical protein
MRHLLHIVTRVNSINVLDEGLRIGGIGRRMNSKVKVNRNKCISKVNLGVQPGLLSICPTPSPPGPIYRWPGLEDRVGSDTDYNIDVR